MKQDVIELAKQDRVQQAYEDFMVRLFSEVPKNVGEKEVNRSVYEAEMKRIQNKYSIRQGDPDFLEWVLTLVGRSPKIIEDGETDE